MSYPLLPHSISVLVFASIYLALAFASKEFDTVVVKQATSMSKRSNTTVQFENGAKNILISENMSC